MKVTYLGFHYGRIYTKGQTMFSYFFLMVRKTNLCQWGITQRPPEYAPDMKYSLPESDIYFTVSISLF